MLVEEKFAALVDSLTSPDASGDMPVLPAHDASPLTALRALVLEGAPLSITMLATVRKELQRAGARIYNNKLRTYSLVMADSRSDIVMVAQPLEPSLAEITAAFEHLLGRMNAFVAAPPDDEVECTRQTAVLIADFVKLHPFLHGIWCTASALLAAIVRRTHAKRPVIHIGAHTDSRHLDWCLALMNYQSTGKIDDAAQIIQSAIAEELASHE